MTLDDARKATKSGRTMTPLEMAESVSETVRGGAVLAEELRTLPDETVKALWQSGLMTFMNPTEAGGREPTLLELIDVWQELAWQDGSVGWIAIANFPSAAFCASYLPDAGFVEMFGPDGSRPVTAGGQFAPNGQGKIEQGGYRVSGTWNFGSGTGHSEYVVGGFMAFEGDELVMEDDGVMPKLLVAVFPRAEIEFLDGWHVTGLKGTGSYDYRVADRFVPADRVFPLFTRAPLRGGSIVSARNHAAHGSRSCCVGARRREEHARRRDRVSY